AVMVLRSKNNKTEDNFYYFRDQKDMRFAESELTVVVDKEKNELTVSTDVAARMVTIELDMEQLVMKDNFFDLLPNQKRVIAVHQVEGKEIPWDTLSIKAMNSRKIRGDLS
ncbi:glycoside hydrolase family 2 protein, partial [Neobacillus drentensis]